jgi:multidrug efflux system membrane fusion protein
VWRIDAESMQVSRTPVTLGEMTGADIRVTSGIKVGDMVAVSGAAHLKEGMQVRPLTK